MAELLAPAGTLKHLQHAFAYGADAVYAGMPRYGLRVRENHFNHLENIQKAIDTAHKLDKKIYIASNIFAHNSKLKTFIQDLAPIVKMQPCALIMADPGLILLTREKWPDLTIHLSVQANTLNYATVRFWQTLGIARIILSRELSFEEIEEIRQNCPDIELEVFVHGALCMAYSGRCLLSGFINHRDANQGACTNACRWQYKQVPADVADNGELKEITNKILIEEQGRPNQAMQMEEDEHGSYIMNSKDLRAIEHIKRLLEIGIDSFKIEGRTKSIYYVSRVVQAYRQAIDDAKNGAEFNPKLLSSLENLANRGYTDGFFQRHSVKEYQNYLDGNSHNRKQIYVAEIEAYDHQNKMINLLTKNKICLGDRLEVILPNNNVEFVVDKIFDMNNKPMAEVPGGSFKVKIPFAEPNVEFGLVARNL